MTRLLENFHHHFSEVTPFHRFCQDVGNASAIPNKWEGHLFMPVASDTWPGLMPYQFREERK